VLVVTAGCGGDNHNEAPTASAGPDQVLTEGMVVQLDGSGSSDPDGDALAYQWNQVDGQAVTLSDPVAAKPSFVAPGGKTTDEQLTFVLVVNDGDFTSEPDTVTVTVLVAPPPVADGFLSTLTAALSEGQFTLNNVWTQADLDYENISDPISYQGKPQPAGRVRPYTTLVQQYRAKRRQCQQDSMLLQNPGSFTMTYLGVDLNYYFQDRKCYPAPVDRPNGFVEPPGGVVDPVADQALHRYGYYCGGGFPGDGMYTWDAKAPEPLDGVDYCCKLHDASTWGTSTSTFSHPSECGILMCLSKASGLPASVMAQLPDVEAARQDWYDGAAAACFGIHSYDAQPPVEGP
jgi:hypothetical protein